MAIIFGQYQLALDLYNSIDPRKYLDMKDRGDSGSNTLEKDQSQEIKSIIKLLTLNAEGKSPFLNIELGKIVCIFKKQDLGKAFISLDKLMSVFHSNRSKIGNHGKTVTASNFANYLKFAELETKVLELYKDRKSNELEKISYVKYIKALDDFTVWVTENYLDVFKDTI
jgi:hypothetical protein